MIALLMAAGLAAASPALSPAVPGQPDLIQPSRAGITSGTAKLCAASGKVQAVSPQVFKPSERRQAYKLIDLPPGHLCLAGGSERVQAEGGR